MSYSVWLRLSGESQRIIQSAIVKAALMFETPTFPVHLTLATRLNSREDALSFAQNFSSPRSLKIDPVPYAVIENDRWQTTVVLRVFGLSSDSLPYPAHISLIYHLLASADLRLNMAEAIRALLPADLPDVITTGSIEIWDTHGGFDGISAWRSISDTAEDGNPEKFFDVAFNITDGMFDGIYHEKSKHQCDRDDVVMRAVNSGCTRMLLLGGSIEDSAEQLRFSRSIDTAGSHLFTTVGIHPTRTTGFLSSRDIPMLRDLIACNLDRVVAVGECGLDADREQFAPMDLQVPAFEAQLCLAAEFRLPLLLHFRGSSCFGEFVRILRQNRHLFGSGVVHSFTGTREEMETLTSELNLTIGVNGCSLRDESFLNLVLPFLPIDKLVFETDAPYCDIRPTHPSHKFIDGKVGYQIVPKPEKWVAGCLVKGRNEPCLVAQVAAVVARLHPAGQQVIQAAYENALRIFSRSA